MDSKKVLGVPVSATESAPPMVSSSTSSGIRAPLTLDDSDIEDSVSTSGKKDSDYSSYASDSDGFLSGEERLETASGRTFLAEKDEEIHEEINFVKEYVVSRPSVKIPVEKINHESSSGRKFDDYRPFLHYPNEENVEENDFVEDYRHSKPFLANKCEEDVGTSMVGGENAAGDELPIAAIGTPMLQKQGMPIAKLSGDSDDDSLGNESIEDEPYLDVVRVPSSGVLESLLSAPKVRVLDVGEGNDSASLSDYGSEAEVVQDLILVGGHNGQEKQMTHDLIPADVIEDKGPDISEEAKDFELHNIQEFHRNSEENNVGVGNNSKISKSTNLINQETSNSSTPEANCVVQVEQVLPCQLIEAEVTEGKAKGSFAAASNDGGNCENEGIDLNGTVVLSCCNDGEKLVSETEHKIDQKYKSGCYDVAKNVEPIDGFTKDSKLSETHLVHEPECSMNGHSAVVTQRLVMEDVLYSESSIPQDVLQCTNPEPERTCEVGDDSALVGGEVDWNAHDINEKLDFEGSKSVDIVDKLEQFPTSSPLSHGEGFHSYPEAVDPQVLTDSGDEPGAHGHGEGVEILNSFSMNALLRAATGVKSESSRVMFASADGAGLFHLEQPVSMGSRFFTLRPTAQPSPTLFNPEHMDNGKSVEIFSQEKKKKLDKLQDIRVKFLRLVHRLKTSPEDSVAAKVLYQLELAAGRLSAQAFNFDYAKRAAMELEAEGKNDLNFSVNILVIGKCGVGKSATVNSIFGEERATVNAFEPATTSVKEITGTLDGVQIRILDTPGIRTSLKEQSYNRRILSSIKKFTKKFPPDIVLYVDRLDTQTSDLNDLPVLKSITSYLGSSMWYRTIVTLTHAASPPPEGQSGYPLSYDLFLAQRSHVVQQLISHSAGNLHTMKPGLIPVAPIENHSRCERNKNKQIFLPSEEIWRSQLLLLCYSMKILAEIDSVVKINEAIDSRKLFGFMVPSPALPYFMSSLLQSNAHPKLSTIEGGNVDSDIELAYSSDHDKKSEDDQYDQLPPFKPLKKSEIAKLNKEQRNAYLEECDYRVKLLQKKHWCEEVRKFQDAKKKQKEGAEYYSNMEADQDLEMEHPAAVAASLPDMVLPPSFDGDNPVYRYRFLESSSQLVTRPVLDLHGWDHDCGFDGVKIEDNRAIAGRFPAVIDIHLTKDKEEFNIHLNSCFAAKLGDKGSTMVGLDIDTVGKQLAYILKAETKLRNVKVNRTAAGASITFLGKKVIAGLKVEDQLAVGKHLFLVGSSGLLRCEHDAAYGASLGIRLKEKDYPVGQAQSTLGLSLMRWRGDLLWGLNLQSQFSVKRNSKMSVQAGFNSKQSGQISVQISSSDQLLIASLVLLPIARTICRKLFAQLSQR